MAAVTPPSDQAAELLQKLSLDSQQAPEPANKASFAQYAPVDAGSQANGPNNEFDRSATPFGPGFSDTSMFQNPNGFASSTYYYGGGAFNGSSVNDWERYSSPNGVEIPPGVYGDYQNSYGYAPYVPYSSSGSPMGYDSQLYATQQYQYPTSYFQPSGMINGAYTSNQANTSQADVSTSITADRAQLSMGTTKGNQSAVGNALNNRTNASKPLKSNYQNPSVKSNDFYGWGGLASASSVNSSTFSYSNNYASGRNQNLRSLPHLMVNASGQFVGLAEMIGPVDFEQTVGYWQQDKWTGCFPVKWHIIKDVQNSMLRHITLPNNENKPVTNSRDTQEVNFEQGIEIIKIFKGHSSRTCILDDFDFYEGRQRTMQEKKAKQKEVNQQLADDIPTGDTENTGLSSNQGLQRSLGPGSSLAGDCAAPLGAGTGVVESSGELNNGPATKAEDSLRSSSSDIKENKAISNGPPK